jgi:hypothetical protein
LTLLASLPLAACAQPPLTGGPASTPSTRQALEPDVADALRRMGAVLAAAPAFTVRVRAQREVRLPNHQVVLLGATGKVPARRPDRLAAWVDSDLGSFSLWYDGGAVTVWDPKRNAYATSPATGALEQTVAWLEDRLGLGGPIRPLLAADPYAALVQDGETTGVHVGRGVAGVVAVNHYALHNPDADWEIWIEAGLRPLPKRISVVERGDRGPSRVTIEFDDWNPAPPPPNRAFAFAPPCGFARRPGTSVSWPRRRDERQGLDTVLSPVCEVPVGSSPGWRDAGR